MSQEKDIRLALAKLVITAVNKVYGVDISSMENDIEAKLELPKEYDMEHNIAFPCFALGKPLTPKKPKEVKFNDFIFQIASELTNEINTNLLSTNNTIVEKCKNEGPYINFYYLPSLLGSTIPEILSGSFLAQRPHKNENVMIEYSQPNTHKTFHVGHMRNAALGNSLVLLYEWCGYHVHAVNYIGDVGAHIAKCLWYFLYFVKKTTLEEFEAQELGREQIIEMLESARPQDIPHVEWLGELYTKGFYELDFASWTKYPLMGYITAKIEEINNHPSNDKWKVLKVTNGTEHFTVVCGGKDYKVNDVVPYAPLGSKKGARLVTEVDKQGVTSQGFILSEAELETSENKEKIHVFPVDTPVGIELTELGRNAENVDPNITNITQEMKKREAQVKSLLRAMEDHQKNISMLWEITRQWSIDDFKEIYKWSDCRFDHYFHESDVGDESKEIVLKAYEEGKLIKSDGAIGADLGKQLGFCVLLTSAGTGLYATKDLALAKRKFEEFKVDRSVYVVDVSQSLHFQQVFKTLEILGFEQAKKCKHLAYGMVVLPDGKMSSRKGNIIYFSTLQKLLTEKIYQDFMVKYKGVWSDEEINETTRKIAISAIKYGMLNQDNNKDIVFDLKEWASKSGNTGPYLMYAYARAKSTLEKVGLVKDAPIDYGLLSHESEKKLLSTIRQFSAVVERAAEQYKPQLLCIFLYTLCKQFSKMYEAVSIKNAETEILKQTRLRLVSAFSEVLKHGLALLGITTAERM